MAIAAFNRINKDRDDLCANGFRLAWKENNLQSWPSAGRPQISLNENNVESTLHPSEHLTATVVDARLPKEVYF